jgi:hypothetical protein
MPDDAKAMLYDGLEIGKVMSYDEALVFWPNQPEVFLHAAWG